jgi:hypothetical protein
MNELHPIHIVLFVASPFAIYFGYKTDASKYERDSLPYFLAQYSRSVLLITGWGGWLILARVLLFGFN